MPFASMRLEAIAYLRTVASNNFYNCASSLPRAAALAVCPKHAARRSVSTLEGRNQLKDSKVIGKYRADCEPLRGPR